MTGRSELCARDGATEHSCRAAPLRLLYHGNTLPAMKFALLGEGRNLVILDPYPVSLLLEDVQKLASQLASQVEALKRWRSRAGSCHNFDGAGWQSA